MSLPHQWIALHTLSLLFAHCSHLLQSLFASLFMVYKPACISEAEHIYLFFPMRMLQWPTSRHNNNKWILCVKSLGSINKLITVTSQEQLTNFKTKSWKMKTGRWLSAANSNHCIDSSHLNLLLHESTVLIFIVVIIMLGCGSFVKCTLYNICNIIIQSKQSLLLYQLQEINGHINTLYELPLHKMYLWWPWQVYCSYKPIFN